MSNDLFTKGTALMALDVGKKRIGIAVCDKDHILVSPLTTIHRKKFTLDAPQIITLIKEWGIGGIVVGWPLNMDGTEGPMCQSVKDFTLNLQKFDGFPNGVEFAFHDERLTSEAAERALIDDLDLSRDKRKGVIDQMAAVEILKDFLGHY